MMVNNNLVGGIPSPLKDDGVRQLGLLFQTEWKHKIHVPNHQPVMNEDLQLGKSSKNRQFSSKPRLITGWNKKQSKGIRTSQDVNRLQSPHII